jgi:hypothetical protein
MKPPSYPLRPINGGPLPRARIKPGVWSYEPKINGWRAVVNTRTGEMWNRKGERLSIEKEFAEVLDTLRSVSLPESMTWLDCEALERRHNVGRGSLVVLDYIPTGYDKTPYLQRRETIRLALCNSPAWEAWRVEDCPRENKLMFFDCCYDDGGKAAAWDHLQRLNTRFHAELFEGLVAKRTDSLYPPQLRSPSLEFPLWVKHRWEF